MILLNSCKYVGRSDFNPREAPLGIERSESNFTRYIFLQFEIIISGREQKIVFNSIIKERVLFYFFQRVGWSDR